MKTLTIPKKMSNSGSIHDIASDNCDREIKFRKPTMYAVVLASYYGGKGYKTFSDINDACREYLRTKESCQLLDCDGNRYCVLDCGNGKFIAEKI